MPTFQKATAAVYEMAKEIIEAFHPDLKETNAAVDIVMAYPDLDEDTGEPINDALKWAGVKALGVARVMPSKDRSMGRGDGEICLDAPWWEKADERDRKALLDHELHHFVPKRVKGIIQFDDKRRVKLKLRKHDVQVGWFKVIAERHGVFSQECQQAAQIWEGGQSVFWPKDGYTAAKAGTRFSNVAKEVGK